MSASQLQKILGDSQCAKEVLNDGKKVYLFVYDRHYIFKGFETDYPSASFRGVAWLNGWEWHLQNSGKANIRPIYEHEAGFIREKIGERGTFGYIFTIAPSDVERLRSFYRGSRIKLTAKVDMGCKDWTPDQQVEIVTFFDPYDTASSTKLIWNSEASEENLKWTDGLYSLNHVACPAWYTRGIADRLRGLDPIPTTVGGIYVKPEQRRANGRRFAKKSPIEEMLKRKPQEGVSKSTSAAGNLRVLNGVQGNESRVKKGPNIKTIKRPSAVRFDVFKAAKAASQK